MKKNIINKFLLGAAALVLGGMVSCEDYLTIYPTGSITKEDFWTTRNDVDNVRAAAYYQLTQQVGNILVWGEFRSDDLTLNKMDQTDYLRLQEAVLQPTKSMFDWSGFYKGINYCNEVLENGQRMIDEDIDPSFSTGDWMPIKAEMVSLRALYYFYLVRAYRDVPYVTHSVSTDTEAKASRIAATPGYAILDSLIKDVEAVQGSAAKNYGNSTDNKGRWTTYSISALLADLYLWRACLVKGISTKTDASGAKYAFEGSESDVVSTSLNKCVENCDVVLNYLKSEYDKKLNKANVPDSDPRRQQVFPLSLNTVSAMGGTTDNGYGSVFGTRNGDESVFELQFDGTNTVNGFLSTYLYGNGSGSYAAGIMKGNPVLFGQTAKVDPSDGLQKGYGKTDFRYCSSAYYEKQGQSDFPIIKNVATSISITDAADVSKGSQSSGMRSNSNQDGNWPVYRLADVMMMKSEALARIIENGGSASAREGYHLCNNLFARNNPGCDSLKTDNQNYCARLAQDWVATRSNSFKAETDTLLNLTYCERQREFIGEGKRWFDLVRQCEWSWSVNSEVVLSEWMSLTNTVKNRCRSLWSLYNPIYSDEMKVNGVGYGDGNGKLVQNPIWQKYMQD